MLPKIPNGLRKAAFGHSGGAVFRDNPVRFGACCPLLDATLSGGAAEDFYTTEDEDGNAVYYYVALTSSTKTSGDTSSCNPTQLVASGTYPVMDPSACYAIKGGTVEISGGTVRVRATGTAGRGIGGDSLAVTGGALSYDTGNGEARVEAASLVRWLDAQTLSPVPVADPPDSFATADLESWLADDANAGALLAYTGADLGVSGDSFLFTPPSGTATSIGVSIEGATDLLAGAPWSADALVCAATNEVSGVETYVLPETENGEESPSCAFARLAFTPRAPRGWACPHCSGFPPAPAVAPAERWPWRLPPTPGNRRHPVRRLLALRPRPDGGPRRRRPELFVDTVSGIGHRPAWLTRCQHGSPGPRPAEV